jgi:hypothetical protein
MCLPLGMELRELAVLVRELSTFVLMKNFSLSVYFALQDRT